MFAKSYGLKKQQGSLYYRVVTEMNLYWCAHKVKEEEKEMLWEGNLKKQQTTNIGTCQALW